MKCPVTLSIDSELLQQVKQSGAVMSEICTNAFRDSLKESEETKSDRQMKEKAHVIGLELGFTEPQIDLLLNCQQWDSVDVWRNFKPTFKPSYNLYVFLNMINAFRKEVFESLL